MIDFLQMSKDAVYLETDILKLSLIIGAYLGFAFTILYIISFVQSEVIKHDIKYYIKGAVKSIAWFVGATVVITLISNCFLYLRFNRSELTKIGGIKAVKEEALKNGVSNLEDLNYNVEYLSEKYKDEIYNLNYRNTLNYSLSEVKSKTLPKLDESDYINSILNKFYLDNEIVENVDLLIDETNLEYDKVYKELKK
jgi:hypothetical protein